MLLCFDKFDVLVASLLKNIKNANFDEAAYSLTGRLSLMSSSYFWSEARRHNISCLIIRTRCFSSFPKRHVFVV